METEEGMVEVQQRFDERFYYIKDHLGSIRVTIDQTNQVTAAQDYSAYGEIWRDINTATPTDRYKFTEKELDIETGHAYHGARYYDPWRITWNSPDPLEDKFAGFWSYNYCLGNPLIFIDQNGEWPDFVDYYINKYYGLKSSERKLAREHPFAALVVDRNQTFVLDIEKALFKKNTNNQINKEPDAFRHTFLSALNSWLLGPELAKKFGDAHEDFPANPENQKEMDLYNNSVGYELGKLFHKMHLDVNGLAEYVYQIVMEGGTCKIINDQGEVIFIQIKKETTTENDNTATNEEANKDED